MKILKKLLKMQKHMQQKIRRKKKKLKLKIMQKVLVYNSEKTLNDLGDKISGEEKAKVETEIENTKKALETNDTAKIKEATEKLTKVFYDMSEQLYKNANPNGAAGAEQMMQELQNDGPKTDEMEMYMMQITK